jgi:hypothetical protein
MGSREKTADWLERKTCVIGFDLSLKFLGDLGVSAVNQFNAYCMKVEVQMKSSRFRRWFWTQVDFWRFAFVDAADATHQAAHRQLAPGIGEEDFAGAGATIAPTLQDGQVLVAFDSTGWLGSRE